MDEDLKYEDLPDEPYVQNDSAYTVRIVAKKRSANEEFFAGFLSGAIWVILLLLLKEL